ncbi:hypothetical protein PFZ55_34155 [Streptomyces sp. MS2A]|nr:hypothetical protein [Streptomyces sp. MS2A]
MSRTVVLLIATALLTALTAATATAATATGGAGSISWDSRPVVGLSISWD